MNFRELGLIAPILRALTVAGYTEPTPIQVQAIPPALAGRDVLGCAQTGTGKTCAFAAPILQRLGRGRKDGIRALILTPTRELALQIGDSFAAYGTNLNLRHAVIFGGVGAQPQIDAIQGGLDILVATPGRLLDLHGQGLLDLSKIEIFVLDEADRMLDMGFIHDVRKVLKLLPEKKQTLLFSATMPPEVMGLVNSLLKDYVRVAVDPISSPVEVIDQSLYFVDKGNKSNLLAMLLEEQHIPSALVFTRTKHGANRIAQDMQNRGISAAAIHGNKSQTARVQALGDFKAGKIRVLVATDIAARGIDIEEMPCVVNYNLPDVPETYVHRIGRTGRAGHGGIAISFCQFDEMDELKAIEKLLKKRIPVVENHPYPMVNKEPPKLDKNGRPVNAEDLEARQAAQQLKAEQQRRAEEKKAAAAAAAAAQQDQVQPAPPSKPAPQPAAPAAKGKKSKGQQSVEEKHVEPKEDRPQEPALEESGARSGGLSKPEIKSESKILSGLKSGKEEPDDEQWKPRIRADHPLTANLRQGRLEDTLPAEPSVARSEFIKPSPLDFDTVIDATARLLSARSAESWKERIRRVELGEYPEPGKKKQGAQQPAKKGAKEAAKPAQPAEKQAPAAAKGAKGQPQPQKAAKGKQQAQAQQPQAKQAQNGKAQAAEKPQAAPKAQNGNPPQSKAQANNQGASKQQNGKGQPNGKQPPKEKPQANGKQPKAPKGKQPQQQQQAAQETKPQGQNPAPEKPAEQPQKPPKAKQPKQRPSRSRGQAAQEPRPETEPVAAAPAAEEPAANGAGSGSAGAAKPRHRRPPRPRRTETAQPATSMKPYYIAVDHDED